jgi:hypothetical protein
VVCVAVLRYNEISMEKHSIFALSTQVLEAARSVLSSESKEAAQAVYSSNNRDTHTCVRCKVIFDSLEEQREHFRSGWHRVNLQVAGLRTRVCPQSL